MVTGNVGCGRSRFVRLAFESAPLVFHRGDAENAEIRREKPDVSEPVADCEGNATFVVIPANAGIQKRMTGLPARATPIWSAVACCRLRRRKQSLRTPRNGQVPRSERSSRFLSSIFSF